jgi:hypothetical protein
MVMIRIFRENKKVILNKSRVLFKRNLIKDSGLAANLIESNQEIQTLKAIKVKKTLRLQLIIHHIQS